MRWAQGQNGSPRNIASVSSFETARVGVDLSAVLFFVPFEQTFETLMSGRRPISLRRSVELARAGWALEARRRRKICAGCSSTRRVLPNVAPQRDDSSLDSSGRWAAYAHLDELNRVLGFEPLSEADARRLEDEARENSSDDVLDRHVCAVSDTWVFSRNATRVRLDAFPFQAMQVTLVGGSWCSQPIVDYYDCSGFDARLRGLLLSRKAFRCDDDGNVYAWIESSALQYLRAIENRIEAGGIDDRACKPPKFAIADGFVAGAFEEIDNANYIERQTVGLVQIRGVVKVVYGGPGNVLNSHVLGWDNRDATVASRIPSVVSRENFHVILAGPMTPAQEVLMAKRHECSGERVRQVHDLLRRVNPLYADVGIGEAHSRDSSSITTRLQEGDDTQQLIAQARARQATITHGQDVDGDQALRECTVVESHTVLLDTMPDRVERDRLARAVANVVSKPGTYVARRSTTILQSTDPYYMERLFPHLLTFGVGGFATSRRHRYSQRAIVLHYLNLSSNRFAEDPMFKLVMFDFLSTKRVQSGVFLRVGQDPSLATTAMRVTPEQLRSAMNSRAEQRSSWRTGRPFVPPAENAPANTLLRSINAATAKMWGSNEERESMLRKADALTIRHGAPSVFWTLTPNPDCSLVCAFWTGRALPNGRPDALSKCGEMNMPCSSDMARLIMGNTTVQAQYYSTCCYLLIDILFGWDTKGNKPKSRRGIFGFVEALLYALEQQGRLFIHHHGVAWIAGLPKTQSDWDRLLASADLRKRFENYCSSIFSAELPVYSSVESFECPRIACNGRLFPVRIERKYKHLLKSSAAAPAVAECDVCGEAFGESDITLSIIEKQWSALDEENRIASTASAVMQIRHRFCGFSRHRPTADVQMSRLLLLDQVHATTHTRSCVKGKAGTKCRYKFFRKLVPVTCLNADNEVVYRRRIGNQWLNPYINIWRRVLHFNMDARILLSGDSLQAARYALQYALKRQNVLDNVAVVNMAFKRRVSREMAHQTSVYAQGIGRLLSLAYSSSGVMEIGGPLASAILHAGEAVTFGCDFERLVLVEGLNLLNNITVEATVFSRNNQIFAETSISRYLERPNCLEDISWYDFVSWIWRGVSSRLQPAAQCSFVSSDPRVLHDHLREHGYRRLEYPRVPEIVGPRLPDSLRLGHEDYCDQTELYYRIAALLYRPFRDVRVFLDAESSARTHFELWAPFTDAATARRLDYHQQHYIGLKKAEEYRARARASSPDDSDDDSVCDEEDVVSGAAIEQCCESRQAVQYEAVPAEFYTTDVDIDMGGDAEANTWDDEASPVEHLLLQALTSVSLPPDESFELTASTDIINRSHIQAFNKLAGASNVVPGETPMGAGDALCTRAVTVQDLHQALQNLPYDPHRQPVETLGAYASVQEVSTHFRLNYLQHVAFTLIAVPLLRRFVGVAIPGDDKSVFDDTPVIVTGAGGTGKSQIISAVRGLAASWNQPRAISVVASTGIVAAGLQGSTMHASVGLGINGKVVPKHIVSPSDALLQQWAPVHCVIADEVSMTNLGFFGLWEESLRHVCENKADFGGLLTVLMFDHCQLRCVKGLPMFKKANGDTPLTAPQKRGAELYGEIKKVVYLTQNMRFSRDPEWGDWLASGRLGNWPSACRDFISSLPRRVESEVLAPRGVFKTISTDNATRVETNDAAVRVALRSFGSERRVYVVPAHVSRRATPTEVALLRQLPDNETGHIPLFLHLYVGMPVRVKANQCVFKGVANGAAATIHHIDWDPSTTFARQTDGTWLPSVQPRNVYIDVAVCGSSLPYPGLPSRWPATVMPVHIASASVRKMKPSLTIKGFPLVPAFGTTVHGVQGETLDVVAVTNLRPPHVRAVDTHALYVALSRLTTRHGLHWVGSPPTHADFDFFVPDSEVMLEDARLKLRANTTLESYNNLASRLSVHGLRPLNS